MNSYLLIILSFFATLVGLFGDTYNHSAKGLRKLNFLGYTTLAIAVFVLVIAAKNTSDEISEKKLRTESALNELRLTLFNVHTQVHNCLMKNGDLETNLADLERQGHTLEEALSFYQDVLPSEANRRIRYIKYVLTDKRYWSSDSYKMLWNLEDNLNSLSKLIRTDSMSTYVMEEHPVPPPRNASE
jgi:hypothetical protein